MANWSNYDGYMHEVCQEVKDIGRITIMEYTHGCSPCLLTLRTGQFALMWLHRSNYHRLSLPLLCKCGGIGFLFFPDLDRYWPARPYQPKWSGKHQLRRYHRFWPSAHIACSVAASLLLRRLATDATKPLLPMAWSTNVWEVHTNGYKPKIRLG